MEYYIAGKKKERKKEMNEQAKLKTEIIIAVTWEGWDLIEEGIREALGDGHMLYLDLSGNHLDMCVKFSLSWHSRLWYFIHFKYGENQ